jgi:hypothetical protein
MHRKASRRNTNSWRIADAKAGHREDPGTGDLHRLFRLLWTALSYLTQDDSQDLQGGVGLHATDAN